MFIKVKVVEECNEVAIRKTIEKFVNTDFIATVEPYPSQSRRKYEGEYVDTCKIKLINGDKFEIIGDVNLQDGHIHIDAK